MRADVTTSWVTAAFDAAPGEVLALVGPNGAGKTTLLRALAGLEPATGSLELRGRDVLGLAPHARSLGWVPQERMLFEHLSALDNVAYGLRARGAGRAEARRAAGIWLERLGIGDLSARRPRQLSGGEAARVALARALAPEPDLVLLDEPLAALDAEVRDDVRRVLRTALSAGAAPAVVVTHDPVDVVALADRVVVLEEGRVVQDGTPAELTIAPRTAWVAGLLGQNAWRGATDATGLLVDGGGHISAAEPLPAGRRALALAEPSAVFLHLNRPEGSARTVIEGQVAELRSLGGRVRVVVRGRPDVTAEITLAAAADLQLADGARVFASLKATEVRMVDMEDPFGG
jgi:molybdate transport system permease protein